MILITSQTDESFSPLFFSLVPLQFFCPTGSIHGFPFVFCQFLQTLQNGKGTGHYCKMSRYVTHTIFLDGSLNHPLLCLIKSFNMTYPLRQTTQKHHDYFPYPQLNFIQKNPKHTLEKISQWHIKKNKNKNWDCYCSLRVSIIDLKIMLPTHIITNLATGKRWQEKKN